MDRRKDLRFKTQFDVLVSSGPAEGIGVLTDLSYSGARLANASLVPEVGSSVRLYVFVQPIAPFELTGAIVRHAESGFAIAYDGEDTDVRRLVDDIGAIVAVPGGAG
jgi:hypothetical protein